MSTSSKSPRRVALAALAVGLEVLPAYAHRYAPKLYTQPQLFALLVLKRHFQTDYRGLSAILAGRRKGGEEKVSAKKRCRDDYYCCVIRPDYIADGSNARSGG